MSPRPTLLHSISTVSNRSLPNDETNINKEITEVEENDDKEDDGYDPKVSGGDNKLLLRALALNAPEWWLITLGVLGAGLSGLTLPLFAIIFIQLVSEFASLFLDTSTRGCIGILSILKMCESTDLLIPAECIQTSESGIFPYIVVSFVVLGVYQGILLIIRSVVFSVSAERLTKRIRTLVYSSIMKQEIAFFDDPKHSVGKLLIRLSVDATQVFISF